MKYSRRLSKYSRTYDEGTVENSSSYSRPSQKTVEKNAEKIKFVLSLGNSRKLTNVTRTFLEHDFWWGKNSRKNGLHFFRLFFGWAGCKSNYFRLYLRHKFENISRADGCISNFS